MIAHEATSPGLTVLFVASPPAMGGSNVSLLTLLEQLDGQVERIFAGPRGALSERLIAQSAIEEFWELPHRGKWPLYGRIRQMVALVAHSWKARHRVQVIHANATSGMRMASATSALLRIPMLVWAHDMAASPARRWTGPAFRRVLPTTTWAAVSSTAAEVLVESRLARPEEILIVPNPIDPIAVVAPRLNDDAGVNVGYLGGRSSRKGFDILPDVIPEAGGHWLLFTNRTDDDESAPIWEALDRLPDGLIQIEGRADDVREAYRRCDIVFVPSRQESFGRIVAEAMLNGIPVVASDIPPFRDQIGDSEAGVLYPPGDSAAASAAVRRLVEDESLRHDLGSLGRIRASRLAPAAVGAALLALYRSAIAGGV